MFLVKRFLTFILICSLLITSASATVQMGDTSEVDFERVEELLQGTWEYHGKIDGLNVVQRFEFCDGTVYFEIIIEGYLGSFVTYEGSYCIDEIGIKVSYDGEEAYVQYCIDGDELSISMQMTVESGGVTTVTTENFSKISTSTPDIASSAEDLSSGEFADVVQLLEKGVWFFNGGSDATVNRLEFKENRAAICQIYTDGNGQHMGDDTQFSYTLDEENITIRLADGSELVIPYNIDGEALTIGNNEYLTPEQIEADLQGYWGLRKKDTDTPWGAPSEHEYIVYINKGAIKYEYAAKAYGESNGEYYYYGPHSGTYTVDERGLTVNVTNNYQFAFNIVDGKAVMVRCGVLMSPAIGFKGEYGYSFG